MGVQDIERGNNQNASSHGVWYPSILYLCSPILKAVKALLTTWNYYSKYLDDIYTFTYAAISIDVPSTSQVLSRSFILLWAKQVSKKYY